MQRIDAYMLAKTMSCASFRYSKPKSSSSQATRVPKSRQSQGVDVIEVIPAVLIGVEGMHTSLQQKEEEAGDSGEVVRAHGLLCIGPLRSQVRSRGTARTLLT